MTVSNYSYKVAKPGGTTFINVGNQSYTLDLNYWIVVTTVWEYMAGHESLTLSCSLYEFYGPYMWVDDVTGRTKPQFFSTESTETLYLV